ncbi:hypothetical protein [Streptomyces sp. IMTB 1903]|uniref:hypothetical protein n=1 Tax=Streptomyces sp. IMTB 1903 TaxID=1776680 RepID=UPI0007551E8D|nr:hypothetical protein [Streptomyces sp. IMTB 1903]
MNVLSALASAAFGSTVYLVAYSTARWLAQLPRRVEVAGWVVTGMVLCALTGTVAVASRSVVVGFVVGAGLTPSVHRWILQRRRYTAGCADGPLAPPSGKRS